MWGAISAVLQAIFGAFLNEFFSLTDKPDTIQAGPPPVLDTIDPLGVDNGDLVSRYHRRV